MFLEFSKVEYLLKTYMYIFKNNENMLVKHKYVTFFDAPFMQEATKKIIIFPFFFEAKRNHINLLESVSFYVKAAHF